MSLALYLDDCAYSRRLRRLLEHAGHDVLVPAEAVPPLTGADDREHLMYARASGRAIVTYNARDFHELHEASPDHHGILVVCQDNDPRRDMSYADITRAIHNLERSGLPIAREFRVLNAFRW